MISAPLYLFFKITHRHFVPRSKMATNNRGGVMISIEMDFAAPCQADVGRGWLGTSRFLLQSLILKLSLTQQMPLSSPASLLSLFSPPLLRLICLSFPTPRRSMFPSVCRRVEKNKRNAAWKKKTNPYSRFIECHHDSDLNQSPLSFKDI